MKSKILFMFAMIMAILLPMTLAAQETKGGGKKGDDNKAAQTVTGCLNKGADADHYVLKDDKGKEYEVTGDKAQLAGHANNHNVTITGAVSKDNGKDVLKATDLKMNSMCK